MLFAPVRLPRVRAAKHLIPLTVCLKTPDCSGSGEGDRSLFSRPSVRSRQVASYHRENFAPDCHAKDARAASASERADRISACNFFSLATVLPSSPYDRSLEFLRTKQVRMRVSYFALCAAALVGPVVASLSLGESRAPSSSLPHCESLTQLLASGQVRRGKFPRSMLTQS